MIPVGSRRRQAADIAGWTASCCSGRWLLREQGVGAEAIAWALSVTRSTLRNALQRVPAEEVNE